MSISYYKLGALSYKNGKMEEANQYLTEAMRALENAAKIGEFPQYHRDFNRIKEMQKRISEA